MIFIKASDLCNLTINDRKAFPMNPIPWLISIGVRPDISDLRRIGVVIVKDSHLVLSSGQHSSGYVNFRRIAHDAKALAEIGAVLVGRISWDIYPCKKIRPVDGIIGPRTMGQELALMAATDMIPREIIRLWCDMNDGVASWPDKMDFESFVPGKMFAVVDDVLTTGQAVRATIELIKNSGGQVACVAVVVDRSNGLTAEGLGVDAIIPLTKVDIRTFPSNACPLCQKQIPMVPRPGYGAEWLKDHPSYPTVP
jgi:orotate phosphoribosyltransferase